MMTSKNITIIKSLYDAFAVGDVPGVLGSMSPDIVWNEADNYPYADRNPYQGPQAIAEGVFGRTAEEWDGFRVEMDELLDAGDTIVAMGHYYGTYKATGKSIKMQAVHVWRLADGKIVQFQQHADTLQVARAIGLA